MKLGSEGRFFVIDNRICLECLGGEFGGEMVSTGIVWETTLYCEMSMIKATRGRGGDILLSFCLPHQLSGPFLQRLNQAVRAQFPIFCPFLVDS